MQRSDESIPPQVDCLILGGGITGAGVARDAAMRGLSTLLLESRDFASGTSHVTSKLIHGGLRYLQHGHFRLVLEGIVERERLLTSIAPHLVRPLRFLVTFGANELPRWTAAVAASQLYGLLQWWHTGLRSGVVSGRGLRRDYPLLAGDSLGIRFWDAQANDARLVIASLRSASSMGARIRNYTRVVAAEPGGDGWTVELVDGDGNSSSVRAATLVNATGPWSALTSEWLGTSTTPTMWIKGSHILLQRPVDFGDDAVVLRSVRDGRILWAVPWHNRVMVGSTESHFEGDLREVHPSRAEIDDLFESFVAAFPYSGVTRGSIRCAYAGIRPIVQQETSCENSLSRRHCIEVDEARRLVTVSGGKLTTFRRMAEETVDRISDLLHRPQPTRDVRRRLRNMPLWPGLSARETADLERDWAALFHRQGVAPETVSHLIRQYGADARGILDEGVSHPEQLRPVSQDLPHSLAEFRYVARHERVRHMSDIVKRRTGLYFLANEFGEAMLSHIARAVGPVLGWDEQRQDREVDATLLEFEADVSEVGAEYSALRVRDRRAACA